MIVPLITVGELPRGALPAEYAEAGWTAMRGNAIVDCLPSNDKLLQRVSFLPTRFAGVDAMIARAELVFGEHCSRIPSLFLGEAMTLLIMLTLSLITQDTLHDLPEKGQFRSAEILSFWSFSILEGKS